jgi:3-methyladenine DNA glycosylase AlkD
MKINFSESLLKDLCQYRDEVFAKQTAKFLRIYDGGYGQGDFLWGLRVPQQRAVVKKYWKDVNLKEVEELLQHKVHEVRFTALMILIEKYKKEMRYGKSEIMKIYLENSEYINNWDLIDLSAPNIPGHYWYNYSLCDLWKYVKSKNLWKERIAIVSTLYFIKKGRFTEAFEISKAFLTHKHDLIHKASGWMLREIGKRDIKLLILFLERYSGIMPRVMLRYSIENLLPKKRRYYMAKHELKYKDVNKSK